MLFLVLAVSEGQILLRSWKERCMGGEVFVVTVAAPERYDQEFLICLLAIFTVPQNGTQSPKATAPCRLHGLLDVTVL